jgi:hypothetical protein
MAVSPRLREVCAGVHLSSHVHGPRGRLPNCLSNPSNRRSYAAEVEVQPVYQVRSHCNSYFMFKST